MLKNGEVRDPVTKSGVAMAGEAATGNTGRPVPAKRGEQGSNIKATGGGT